MIYIFWSCANRDEAKKIIHGLLENRLIACASVFPVESIYTWEGKVESASECKVILKSAADHFEAIRAYISSRCSYQVPEIASINASHVHAPYKKWLEGAINR